MIENTRFGGIPAKRDGSGQIRASKNYILHMECILRVATRGKRVYNFS